MKDVVAIFLIVMYNLTLLTGTVYLIAERDWNPWWMLLTMFLLGNHKQENKK